MLCYRLAPTTMILIPEKKDNKQNTLTNYLLLYLFILTYSCHHVMSMTPIFFLFNFYFYYGLITFLFHYFSLHTEVFLFF